MFLLNDRYEVHQCLGEGSLGRVHLVIDKKDNQKLVIAK